MLALVVLKLSSFLVLNSLYMVTSEKEVVLKRDASTGLFYAGFVDHYFHTLDVAKIVVAYVENPNHCLLRCVKNHKCFSTNIAARPEHDGRVLCELLSTDKYNSSTNFKRSQWFHHYSILVSPLFMFLISLNIRHYPFINTA